MKPRAPQTAAETIALLRGSIAREATRRGETLRVVRAECRASMPSGAHCVLPRDRSGPHYDGEAAALDGHAHDDGNDDSCAACIREVTP